MRRRVYVIAGEYSLNPRHLPPARREREFLSSCHAYEDAEVERAFFRYPSARATGRVTADDWARAFGVAALPVTLSDLLASAAHRAVCALHEALGGGPDNGDHDYERTRRRITHLVAASMPGLDPTERLNIGLIPQALRARLGLHFRCQCHFQVGTSDSGAWAFAEAVRAARTAEHPATILVAAGQVIPSGYAAQYHIRSVLGERDQQAGLDMLAAGDLWMDILRRNCAAGADEVRALLAAVARRKLYTARDYPAAIQSGVGIPRDTPITPYFDKTDIAPPCCGAAAVILTSDEELVAEVVAAAERARAERTAEGDGRWRSVPVVEVLGVGEGSSNPSLLERKSPLVVTPAVRQALAAAADDAHLPGTVFSASAFAVLHDAFPSIELAFLLSLGLSWEEAAYRMQRDWSNPYGGLLAFGHALGASGLVQVVKSFHVFAGDRRHVRALLHGGEPALAFPDAGAHAFTTSVGGPLSHIVVTLLRGGRAPGRGADGDIRSTSLSMASMVSMFDAGAESGELAHWHTQRRQVRHSQRAYLARLRQHVARELGDEAWLVEGATRVNLRSCLPTLERAEFRHIAVAGAERFIAEPHVAEAEEILRATLGELQDLWNRSSLAGMLAEFDDAVAHCVEEWQERGFLRGDIEERLPRIRRAGDGDLVARVVAELKESLNLHLVVVAGPTADGTQRRLIYFSERAFGMLEATELARRRDRHDGSERWEPLPQVDGMALLPWWNQRATRKPVVDSDSDDARAAAATPEALFAAIEDTHDWERSAAELEFLRTYLAPFVSRAAVESAMRQAVSSSRGASVPPVPVILYMGDIIRANELPDPRLAYALLGRAVERARGWLGMYRSTAAQAGDVVEMVCFDDRLRRGEEAVHDAVVSAARFAREVTVFCLRHGVRLRSVVSLGYDGVRFVDVNGQLTAATRARSRSIGLIRHVKREGARDVISGDARVPAERAWLGVDLTHVDAPGIVEALGRELPGWTLLDNQPLEVPVRGGTSVQFAVWHLAAPQH